jgi:hypothetical protein
VYFWVPPPPSPSEIRLVIFQSFYYNVSGDFSERLEILRQLEWINNQTRAVFLGTFALLDPIVTFNLKGMFQVSETEWSGYESAFAKIDIFPFFC